MIADLRSRGHRVLVYQQADNLYQTYLEDTKLQLFKSTREIVDGYKWRAITWQSENDVLPMDYGANPTQYVPADMRHAASGHHQKLNKFLVDYIRTNSIL